MTADSTASSRLPSHGSCGRNSHRRLLTVPSGGSSGSSALASLALLLLVVLPVGVSGMFYPKQNITDQNFPFCGFNEIRRYTLWCQFANVSAFIASNASCIQYGVCIPLAGAESMSCVNRTRCSGFRTDYDDPDYQPEAACLVVRAEPGRTAQCDVSIWGSSIFDAPPPFPQQPPPSPPPKEGSDWALWKTMTIIFSIIGGIAFIVIVVLLIRWFMLKQKRKTSTPITLLTEEGKQKLEQEMMAQGQAPVSNQWPVQFPLQPGPYPNAGVTASIRPTAPNGQPLLGYGSSYPPAQPLQPSLTANGSSRLSPNAGDMMADAAANSRAAYNGPPLRTAPVVLPPQGGLPPQPLGAPGFDPLADAGPGGAPTGLGMPPPAPADPSLTAVAASLAPPPAVLPAALVAPTAATLQNPTGVAP